ncbi:MAG: SurA N-terminal domain-containing protein [Desulfobacterales bacterium]|nr:SurA N-terminal domain-containing protein [Desulfobacterales bacterium]
MLSIMRKKAGSWIIKLLLGAIVLVFVFWGVGSFREKSLTRVALVNGAIITVPEYKMSYNNLIESLRESFGKNLDSDTLKMLNVEKQTMDRLIDQKLLLQEAEKLNFRLTDTELVQAIQNIRAFQTDGRFDRRLYTYVLERARLTPETFEVIQRDAMLIEKVKYFITENAKVSDQEAGEWFNWMNAQVDIEYVVFEPGKYKDLNPTPEELKAYFDAHKESYKTEPKVKAKYLLFESDSYRNQIQLTPQEIKTYYETNRKEFQTPKTVQASHILLKTGPGDSPEKVEQTKSRILEILKMARAGQDFATLAKKYSEDPSKDNGGNLGAFEKDQMVAPFSDQAFSMKAGEISEPVKTQFGWHIIKVEKVNAEINLSLEEATEKIRQTLTGQRTQDLARDAAEDAYDASFQGNDLSKTAQSLKLSLLSTDYFTRKGPDNIKNQAKFAAAALNLAAGDISQVLDLGGGAYSILQVIEKIPASIPEMKDVEKKIRTEWIQEKQDESARKDAQAFLAALQKGEALSAAAQQQGMSPKTTGFFKRGGSIPNIGYEGEIAAVAFKLSNKKQLPEAPVKGNAGYYVIRFRDRKAPEPGEFEAEKKEIKQRLLEQKKATIFSRWLNQVKLRSDIVIEDAYK